MLTKAEKKAVIERERKKRMRQRQRLLQRERMENPIKYQKAVHAVQYEQFLLFMADCLIPMVDKKTFFKPIHQTYLRYCKFIGQDPLMSTTALGKHLCKHFHKVANSEGTKYYLVIKKDIKILPLPKETDQEPSMSELPEVEI